MKKLLIIALITSSMSALAQESKYPLEVQPGKSVKVYSKTDTLWVISNDQIQDYIKEGLILNKADSMFRIFRAEINTLQKVIQKKNEILLRISRENKENKAKVKELETIIEEYENGTRKRSKKKKK